MVRDRRKKKTAHNLPSDILSDLPDNVVESILTRLPLRDAVRTSILSRKWRYSWAKIPELVFDDTMFEGLALNVLANRHKRMMAIYQVLLLHQGPILKFTLSVSDLESCPEIDQMILFLSRNGVEELTLNIRKGDNYELPSTFFSCLQLRHLTLQSCMFKPPPSFDGFSRLISLEFDGVDFDAETFASLVSSCPLLESFTLEDSPNYDTLEFDAPLLNYVCINSTFYSISFKATPVLATLAITSNENEDLDEGGTSNMTEIFGSLPLVESLNLGYRFMKFLIPGGIPDKLPSLLKHLTILQLDQICFGEWDEASFTLCLIRSSPNLETIKIEVFSSTDAVTESVLDLFKLQHYSDFSLYRLREVQIWLISGARPELEFIKLLLAKSPVLEKMFVEPNSKRASPEQVKMLKELTRLKRASREAEIVFEDSDDDQA